MEIKSILFPTDFSEGSSKALQYAVDLTKRYGAKLYLLHVIYDVVKGGGLYVKSPAKKDRYNEAEEGEKKEIEKFGAEKLSSLKDIERHVIKGLPQDEIINFVKRNKIDMIIMGTYERKGPDMTSFGSIAAQVVRDATCPVLLVKLP